MKKVISYKDEESSYSVTVYKANTEMGMRKTLLEELAQVDAAPVTDYKDIPSLSKRLVQTLLYPNLIACVIENEGFQQWPPSYEQFAGLPDKFVAEWERTVFEINAHWAPKPNLTKEQAEALQKKATNSTRD